MQYLFILNHLEGAKGALLDIYFKPLEMVECPEIGMLEDDMGKAQSQNFNI